MDEEIPPALPPEDWERIQRNELYRVGLAQALLLSTLGEGPRPDGIEQPDHAVAALALYGRNFGFTWEMLDALLHIITFASMHTREERGDEELRLAAEAFKRIAALLPPRTLLGEGGT